MTKLNKLLSKASGIGIALYIVYIFCVLLFRTYTGSAVTEGDCISFVLLGMVEGILAMLNFALKPAVPARRRKKI